MADSSFFEVSSEQSVIKSTIVEKYFWAWAKIMTVKTKKPKIVYADLFSGPGVYRDGTISTPIRVLRKIIDDRAMADTVATIFNDRDKQNVASLKRHIAELPGIDTIKYKPVVLNHEVGAELTRLLAEIDLVPTLLFIDPWGYKGLTLDLIGSVLKNWGCDCIFFFNYNRILPGLSHPDSSIQEHINALFGPRRAESLRNRLDTIEPANKEAEILEELSKSLLDIGAEYILPFCFKTDSMRTRHHLVFATKAFLGYEIMKEIMARASSSSEQGVSSFHYCPADKRQKRLFELARPLDDLADMLLTVFAGQTLTVDNIYHEHSVGRRYIRRNYKNVLLQLEAEGKIKVSPHRRGTMPDDALISFT